MRRLLHARMRYLTRVINRYKANVSVTLDRAFSDEIYRIYSPVKNVVA